MQAKSLEEYLSSDDSLKSKLEQAQYYETGTLEERVQFTDKKNPNFNPDDLRYEAEPEYTRVETTIPKGSGKNSDSAIKLYKEIKLALENKQQNSTHNESNLCLSYIDTIEAKIKSIETEIDKKSYESKIGSLLSGYKELLAHYEKKVKSKYGTDFFEKNKNVTDSESFKSEKKQYTNDKSDSKDPGPLVLWTATNNMIISLENKSERGDTHKPFINKLTAWDKLYQGEDGKILKADKGGLARRIGNEIARIINWMAFQGYKEDFQYFKSRGKTQQEDKAVEIMPSVKR